MRVEVDTIINILKFIFDNPGISIKDIKTAFNLPSSTTTEQIRRLKKAGLIVVVHDKESREIVDRRGIRKKLVVRVKRVYPAIVKCGVNGTLIIPRIINNDIGLAVYRCPFYDNCEYRDKKTLEPVYCKFYESLSDHEKQIIQQLKTKIQNLVSKQ